MDHLTSPELAYSQILLARIYEPLVLVNTVISWIRLADLNPCTTCTMYISLTIFLFRSGIAFYFHLFSSSGHCKAQKNMCVYGHTSNFFFFFFFFTIGKTGNSRSRFRNPIFHFRNFRKPSFVEAVLWRVTQFFYLLCSHFQQKASGWINKTLLLIKQHIMNISRYTNIDKFVIIRYIFLLARRAYSWLFQLAQMWKLLAPGVGLVDFLTPA